MQQKIKHTQLHKPQSSLGERKKGKGKDVKKPLIYERCKEYPSQFCKGLRKGLRRDIQGGM